MGKGRGCGADIAGTNLFCHRDLRHRGLGGRGFDGPLDREVLIVVINAGAGVRKAVDHWTERFL